MNIVKNIFNYFVPNKDGNFPRCNCKKSSISDDFCSNIETLLSFSKTNKNFNGKKAKNLYNDLLLTDSKILNIEEENGKQIQRDLNRTYPNCPFFKSQDGQERMLNVLKAFSNYDRDIRYVQGMNFIVGFLLYHSEEYIAFWLFVSLIEDYELRENYSADLPGLDKHANIIKRLVEINFPNIHNKFIKHHVEIKIFISEWLFSLFGSVIPLALQVPFYEGFFMEGWKFFYKLVLQVIKSIENEIIDLNDNGDIYIALKLGKNDEGRTEETYNKKWEKLLSLAFSFDEMKF